MFELVESWRASGQTRQQFCTTHDLKVSRLAYWITRKYRHDRQVEQSGPGGFVPIAPTGSPNEQVAKMVVNYPNGVKLELTHLDEPLIARLIKLW